MKQNKYIIAVFLYFIGCIVYDMIDMDSVGRRVFYYLLQYGLIFTLSLFVYQTLYNTIDKMVLFILMFFSGGMFIFNVFLINKDLITYIEWCNSEKAAMIISFGLIGFAVIVWLFIIKKIIDEHIS
jgi:hypothetical protein